MVVLRRGEKEETAGAFDLGRGRRQSVRPLSYNGGPSLGCARESGIHVLAVKERQKERDRQIERAAERASEHERERERREAERREKERAARQRTAQRMTRTGGSGWLKWKREKRMKRRKIVKRYPGVQRGAEGTRGIRSTIHRAVALALAWRSATPLPRGGGTRTHTHAYTRVRARIIGFAINK